MSRIANHSLCMLHTQNEHDSLSEWSSLPFKRRIEKTPATVHQRSSWKCFNNHCTDSVGISRISLRSFFPSKEQVQPPRGHHFLQTLMLVRSLKSTADVKEEEDQKGRLANRSVRTFRTKRRRFVGRTRLSPHSKEPSIKDRMGMASIYK